MKRLSAIAAPLALLCIVAGFHWRLFTTQYTWMDHPDMARMVLPWHEFQAASWHRGEFPLWDPHSWGGQPLVGQMQPGAVYPQDWLVFLMPLDENGYLRLNWPKWSFVLSHMLAALFCYWLCRDLGRSRAASVLGGAAFSLSGIVGSFGWPQMLNSAIWIPLVLLFFLRAQRGVRPLVNAAWSGVFLGISFLAGHHQAPTLVLLTMTGLWLYQLWRARAHALGPAAAFYVCTFLTGAVQLWPVVEYGARAIRFVGAPAGVGWNQHVPYPIHEQYQLFPRELLALILPHLSDQDVFVGLAVFVLALLTVIAARTQEVRLLVAISIGALLLAFGGLSVVHGVTYALVPSFDKLRNPVVALFIVQFALAVLAACGLDALRAGAGGTTWIRGLTIAGIAPWLVLAVAAMVRAEASREYERLAVFGLVALALAALFRAQAAQRISFPALSAATSLLVLFELGTVFGPNYRHRDAAAGYLAELTRDRDVAQFLRAQPDFGRLEVDIASVPYNIGDWERIDTMQGYPASIPTSVARYVGNSELASFVPRLFSLTHYLGREPIRDGQQEVFRGQSGLNVYRNPDAMPRVWTVHEAVTVPDADLPQRTRAADLWQQVLLTEEAPALSSCASGDDVRSVARTNNSVRYDAAMACRGMLVMSDTYFPGWRAKVDGADAKIYEAYGVLRGVVVDAGLHRIELEYRPWSVYLGALLTLLGLSVPFVLGRTARASR